MRVIPGPLFIHSYIDFIDAKEKYSSYFAFNVGKTISWPFPKINTVIITNAFFIHGRSLPTNGVSVTSLFCMKAFCLQLLLLLFAFDNISLSFIPSSLRHLCISCNFIFALYNRNSSQQNEFDTFIRQVKLQLRYIHQIYRIEIYK